MRKIEQKEFRERYDARRRFYSCQVKVPQVSSKLETLLANSKIECRELYENQMEKITCAKELADWIRDTYMRVKKERGVLYARACLTVMMAADYSTRGMRLPHKNKCVTTWWKLKHVMKRKGQLTVTYVSVLDPLKKETAVVFGREKK